LRKPRRVIEPADDKLLVKPLGSTNFISGLSEAGAALEQIKSILGHLTNKEVRKYIQQARRKMMAADGMRLWRFRRTDDKR
jgi:hypothetical protein